jgi:hypothetical protein
MSDRATRASMSSSALRSAATPIAKKKFQKFCGKLVENMLHKKI